MSWLSKLLSIFKIKQTVASATVTNPVLKLSHPQEAQDTSQTMSTVKIDDVLSQWFIAWSVPAEHREYLKSQVIVLIYDTWPESILRMGIKADTPACTWEQDGKRYLASLASWLNKGVIAHEMAHVSYSLLTEDEKTAFASEYAPLIATDPLVRLLYSQNTYGLTSVIEGHAEVYRYLGNSMPDCLKKYYPKLF